MERSHRIAASALVALAALGAVFLLYRAQGGGGGLTIEVESPLYEYVDLAVFRGIEPLMGKQEVTSILGATSNIQEGDQPTESDPGEKWVYGVDGGLLSYYFERDAPDGGIGTPEYCPNALILSDFLRGKASRYVPSEASQGLIALRRDDKLLMTVRYAGGMVTRINWYATE
jgi:hypothetical protein